MGFLSLFKNRSENEIQIAESKVEHYFNFPNFTAEERERITAAKNLTQKKDFNKAYDIYFRLLSQIEDNEANKRKLRYIKIEIGQIYMYAEKWDSALQAFAEAIQDENSVGNPLLHLRIGQCAYNLENARIYEDNLSRALICGGLHIFENERNEYKETALKLLNPPACGWKKYQGIDYSATK